MKKKILIYAPAAPTYDHLGYFQELAKYKDLEVTALISPHWAANAAGGFTFKNNRVYADRFGYSSNEGYKLINKKPTFAGKSYHLYLSLWTLLNRLKPDIIEYIFEPWNPSLTQILLWRNLFSKKTKILFFTHENIYRTYHDRFFYSLIFYDLVERYNLNHVDGCVGATNEIIQVMKRKGLTDKSLTLVNGDEIDPQFFYKKDVSKLKKKLGLSNFVVGFAGRLDEAKGIMTLIEAAGKLKNENFTLLICGWGDEDFTKKMMDRGEELGIKHKVHMVNKRLGRKIIDYYNLMDVIVVPSITKKYWKEQFGRVNIEAMACGTPVIGSDSGGISEVIGDAGLIFKEKDSEDLKDKLLIVMKNRKLLKELSSKAQKRVLDNFTCQKKAERSYHFYKDLLVK